VTDLLEVMRKLLLFSDLSGRKRLILENEEQEE